MPTSYYQSSISTFQNQSTEEIIGQITTSNQFDSTRNQNKAWEQQINILKKSLNTYTGTIFFEFSIPRMGKRVDAIVIIKNIVFVIEFKVGETKFNRNDIDQVWDYALDLKNFHLPSHHLVLAPILIATESHNSFFTLSTTSHNDNILNPIKIGKESIKDVIDQTLALFGDNSPINSQEYAEGSYSPTPTIIEAAVSMYKSHTVDEITRNDAKAINLTKTTEAISKIIDEAKEKSKKIICFVTGVPGAGKTLVGLKVATMHLDKEKGNTSVYLSGNAPLVQILQEALVRDRVKNEKEAGNNLTKTKARESVKAFIQIIHHYRDAYLVDKKSPL